MKVRGARKNSFRKSLVADSRLLPTQDGKPNVISTFGGSACIHKPLFRHLLKINARRMSTSMQSEHRSFCKLLRALRLPF